MIVDKRTGRRVSELAGPSGPAAVKPPPLTPTVPGAAWRFRDWAWDCRSLCWRPEWRHVSYSLTVRDFGEYVAGTTNGRHWRMAATPVALLDEFFPIENLSSLRGSNRSPST